LEKLLSHVSEMLHASQWGLYLIFFIFPVGENHSCQEIICQMVTSFMMLEMQYLTADI
jgi:hypothetical protein